jgi:hypothetical protein
MQQQDQNSAAMAMRDDSQHMQRGRDGVMAVNLREEAEFWEWWAAKWTTPQPPVDDCFGR